MGTDNGFAGLPNDIALQDACTSNLAMIGTSQVRSCTAASAPKSLPAPRSSPVNPEFPMLLELPIVVGD